MMGTDEPAIVRTVSKAASVDRQFTSELTIEFIHE